MNILASYSKVTLVCARGSRLTLVQEWHIRNNTDFLLSFLAIILMGVFYEWLRLVQSNYDQRVAAQLLAQSKGKSEIVVVIPLVLRTSFCP